MTRTLRWTLTAISELDDWIDVIAKYDDFAALAVKRRVEEAAQRLARHPTGRPGRVTGYFEKPVPKSRMTLCYKETPEEVTIVRCVHQSRDWPKGAWPSAASPPRR